MLHPQLCILFSYHFAKTHSFNSSLMNLQLDRLCVSVAWTASLEVRRLICPESIKQQHADLMGWFQVHFRAGAYLFQTEKGERFWACLSSHSHSACEFSFSPLSHYFDLICLCFGWDSLTYSAPNWKTCLASGSGYAGFKSIFFVLFICTKVTAVYICSSSSFLQVSFQIHYG